MAPIIWVSSLVRSWGGRNGYIVSELIVSGYGRRLTSSGGSLLEKRSEYVTASAFWVLWIQVLWDGSIMVLFKFFNKIKETPTRIRPGRVQAQWIFSKGSSPEKDARHSRTWSLRASKGIVWRWGVERFSNFVFSKLKLFWVVVVQSLCLTRNLFGSVAGLESLSRNLKEKLIRAIEFQKITIYPVDNIHGCQLAGSVLSSLAS